jgi:prevent-host-death family protein
LGHGRGRDLYLAGGCGTQVLFEVEGVPRLRQGGSTYFKNDQNRQNSHFPAYTGFMTTVSATEAKQQFAALLDKAQREPVRIRRHNRDVAVIVSADEYDQLGRMRANELVRFTEETRRYARSQGMTEEVLQELLR